MPTAATAGPWMEGLDFEPEVSRQPWHAGLTFEPEATPTASWHDGLSFEPQGADTGLIERGREIGGAIDHRILNDVREFGAAAGRYIFHGLEGLKLEQAKLLANPPPEAYATSAEETLLPKAEQTALEEKRKADLQAGAQPALDSASYWWKRADTIDKESKIDPQLATTWDARISRAGGEAAVMGMEATIPFAGIPIMALNGAAAAEAEAKNAGKNDAEAEAYAARSLIGLAIFGGANKVAALGVAKLLPHFVKEPGKLATFVAQFVGQDAANEASSRAIMAWQTAEEAKPGEKIAAATKALTNTSLESSTLNAVYAGIGAAHEVGKVRPIEPNEKFDFEPEPRQTSAPTAVAAIESRLPVPNEQPPIPDARKARKASAEEQAHTEYLRELEEEAHAFQSQTGYELKEAVIKAGGLPAKNSPHRTAEMNDLEETIMDPQRKERIARNELFRSDAPSEDQLATRLRDYGFDVRTPDDLRAMLDERFRTGREIFANPESAMAEYYSPRHTETELLESEKSARQLVQEFQGEYGAGNWSKEKYEAPSKWAPENARRAGLPREDRQAQAGAAAATSKGELPEIAKRTTERSEQLKQNREALAAAIEARGSEEEFAQAGVVAEEARRYGRELVQDYAEGVRSGKLPKDARYPIYRGDFTHRPLQYINAADHALSIVEDALAKSGFKPKEDIYFSPRRRKTSGVPPIPPPPLPPGQVLTMGGDLPVTMPRTRPGTVAARDVMESLKKVMVTSGSVGEIRRGRFAHMAKGIFKARPEVVRLEHVDDVPTAVHETGHALMKQFYGTVKSRGLKWVPSAVRRELIGLGKELYGSRKPTAGYTSEGFSEFMRYYLTTDTAKKIAPNTYKFFEEGVMVDHPEVATQLRIARDLIDIYRKQGAIARANTQLTREPGWTRRVLTGLKDFVSFQRIAESGEPLRQLSKEAAALTGRPLSPSADPYKLFKMKRGASGPLLERMVENNMVDVWGNPTGPSLKEALAEVKGQRNEFLLYLFARRALERWSKNLNPGIAREDAAYIRQTLESPQFDRSASKYYQWWDGVLNYLVQADPTMQPAVAAIKKGSSDYAPLARMLDERAVQREALRAQSNPLYRMHGSGLPVKDIFDQTLVSAARLISRANRQLVTNAVVKLAQIEGMGKLLERVPQERVRQSLNIEQIRRDLEDMGIDTTAIPPDEIINYYTPADQAKGSDPIVTVRKPDGTSEWFYVNPKIYDVTSKIEPFSLRTIPYIGPVVDFVLGAPKRIFTMGTTGLRPTFSLLTNPLRDPQGWLLQTKAGINPAKMTAAYFQAVAEQLRGAVTGKEGPITQAALNLGPQMSQALGRDISYTKKASTALFHGRTMRVVKSPIDHLRQLLNLPESFPRLAEFKRVGEEMGWKPGEPISPDQAVELAIAFKEATVDFSAAGDVSRIINEAVPFFNPNIQGVRTAARAFRDHPLRSTLMGISAFTGPALLLWWKNKDKEWYRNLPWRERYYYSNIDDGTNVWQIPRAFEWGNLFAVMPEAALDAWYRRDSESVKQAIGHLFETQNPLDYPVLLRVAKEQWQNRIDFWDRPIVPKGEQDLAPGAQVGPYTSKLATWLGEAFPNQVSPRRVDAAMRSGFGGALPDVLDFVGLGAEKRTREPELADTPIVGRLWRRGGFYNAQSQFLADFWDLKESVDARVKAVRAQMKDPSRPQTVKTTLQEMALAPVLDAAGKNISQAMRIAAQLRESAGRQRLYKFAADEAKQLTDIWHRQEKAATATAQ